MYEIAIIGAGPAGGSAALFSAKAGKKTLLIDSEQGMTKHAWVENHYGIDEITGADLVDIGIRQAKKFGAELVQGKVSNVEKVDGGFRITADNGEYEAQHVILATGAMTDLSEAIGAGTKPGTEPRIKNVFDVDATGRTNIEGIWAAGTCAGVSVHTIITAGDGAKVAINIISEINGTRYVDHDMIKK